MVYTIRFTDLLHARETFPEQRKVKFFWSWENLETPQCAEANGSLPRGPWEIVQSIRQLWKLNLNQVEGDVPLPERLSSSSHRVFLPPALDQRALCLLMCDLGNRASL